MANSKPKPTKTVKVGWSAAVRLTKKYMENNLSIMFTGMPGIGKTDLIKMVSQKLNYNLIIFHPAISDPTDFKGLPWLFKDDKGEEHCVFVPFDQYLALINAKGPTICFLDDLGQAAVAVQAACMQLLHGGNLNSQKISDEVRFVACTNRKTDRAGVSGILEPVKSRFHGIFELVPEIDPFIQWLINDGGSPVLVAFMRSRPQWLTGGSEGWKPEADICQQPCPRTISHLNDVVNLDLDKVDKSTAYGGSVGQAMANEFTAFENLAVSIPDLDIILSNPHGAQAPASADIQYAMLGALHTRMTRKSLQNIYTYLDLHFSKEMQCVFHWDIESYQPSLMQTAAYVNWSKDNADLLTN